MTITPLFTQAEANVAGQSPRYQVKHVADPYEHFWEFHVIDRECNEPVAVCGLIAMADIICGLLNRTVKV